MYVTSCHHGLNVEFFRKIFKFHELFLEIYTEHQGLMANSQVFARLISVGCSAHLELENIYIPHIFVYPSAMT